MSPAGEHVARLPPIVPVARIWGEPTVRAASASAGHQGGQLGLPKPGVGDAGADADPVGVAPPFLQLGQTVDDHHVARATVPEVDLDHEVGAAGQQLSARVVGEVGHGVVE